MKGLLVQKLVDASIPWQQQLLVLTLRVGIVLGAVVYVPSVVAAWQADLIGLMVLDTVVLAAVITLYLAKQWSNRVRAVALCLIVYILSVGLLLTVGPISQIYLFGFSILTTLLLGLRAGLYAAVLSAVSLLTLGVSGLATGMEHPNVTGPLLGWVTIVLNFTLVNVLLTLAVGLVISALEHTLEREIVARRTIDEERTFLRTLIDAIPDMVYAKDLGGRYVTCNRATLARFKVDDELRLIGKTVFDMLPPELASAINAQDQEVMTGRPILNIEGQNVDAEGRPAWFQTIRVPMRNAEGVITGIVGVSRDITERKDLEAQLRQSQKMEAIGQLTGGVAHDFNNLLTIIVGNAEILQEELSDFPYLQALAETSLNAAESGAELTSRLLAFSRKQVLQPKMIDFAHLIHGLDGLLRRTLPENINVEIIRSGGLWKIEADAPQLEAALLNLALNARDAMPEGGCLTIEIANAMLGDEYVATEADVKAGQYVAIVVTDSGSGMEPDVLARVFEPFFTTKAVGKGSGLGLSMVFGFVKQSGGHIRAYSEPGEGTAIKMYFPRMHSAGEPAPVINSRRKIIGGTETVLVVEDNDNVRNYVTAQISALGYQVLEASNGESALEFFQQGIEIDLLFTDVVMPGGLGGRELAEAACKIQPNLKVLYTSGYTENSIVHQGRLDPGIKLLNKPYRRDQLAAKLREMFED